MYGKVPSEETKMRLDKCDLSNKDNFHKNIVKVIDELYTVQEEITPVIEELLTVSEPVFEETVEVNNETEEVFNEESIMSNMIYSKKRKR